MGLDMYLTRKVYVKTWDFTPEESRYKMTIKRGGKKIDHINPDNISYIHLDAAYWRKANHIHNWFVENVQNGQDDCDEYYVPNEKLVELFNLCKTILDSVKTEEGKIHTGTSYSGGEKTEHYKDGKVVTKESAELCESLLPCVSGFFFGGTHYDEYYLNSLEYTIEKLQPYVEMINKEQTAEAELGSFYYQASW
tara:strand:- start:10108 stop:10689 length:582 start_codon:yes stop_codon:yes gene_type:complete